MNASFLLLSVLNVVGASSQGLGPPRARSNNPSSFGLLSSPDARLWCVRVPWETPSLIQGLRGKCHKSMNSSSFVWSLEKIQFGLRPSTKTPPEIRNQGCGKPGLKIHNVTHLFRTPLGCSDKRTVASAPNRRSSSNPQGSSLGFPSFRFFWYRFSSVLRTSERLGDEFWGQPIIIPPCWAEVKREDTQVHQCSII